MADIKKPTASLKNSYAAGKKSAEAHPEQTTGQRIARGAGAGFMSALKGMMKIK